MAIDSINPSDKLQSGFRAKYNETIKEIWTSVTDNGDGTVTFIKHGGAQVTLNLLSSFYSKTQIATMLSGVNPATEETAGIIRIATPEEAMAGESGDTAITPASLVFAMAANGIDALVGTAAPSPGQADLNTIYFQSLPGGIRIYVSRLYDGEDEDAEPFVWEDRGLIPMFSAQSVLDISADRVIEWQTEIAPDETGAPSGQTWAQRFGNVPPKVDVHLDNGGGVYEWQPTPWTFTRSGGLITSVTIPVGNNNALVTIR